MSLSFFPVGLHSLTSSTVTWKKTPVLVGFPGASSKQFRWPTAPGTDRGRLVDEVLRGAGSRRSTCHRYAPTNTSHGSGKLHENPTVCRGKSSSKRPWHPLPCDVFLRVNRDPHPRNPWSYGSSGTLGSGGSLYIAGEWIQSYLLKG